VAKEEKARVFMSGRSQAVRIPMEYRFASDEVYIRRDEMSGAVILSEQPQKRSMEEILAMIDAAREAEQPGDILGDRDESAPVIRDWMK
jgi:antitoxin VapB